MTKQIVWLTDPHLNFLAPEEVRQFLDRVAARNPHAILFTGDLAEGTDLVHYLEQIDRRFECPFYFVLGNHDFYRSSIEQVRRVVGEFCELHPRMHYLTMSGPCELSPSTAVVGHDGWADARIGDYERSYVMMNDYALIAELSGFGKLARRGILEMLGDAAAAHIRNVLPLALERHENVFLLTHVPPMREACWHEGQISDDEWAPHFTCQAMGEAILEIMRPRPDRRLTVLCGHTHGSGTTQPLENVTILTGGAVYGKPAVTGVFEV